MMIMVYLIKLSWGTDLLNIVEFCLQNNCQKLSLSWDSNLMHFVYKPHAKKLRLSLDSNQLNFAKITLPKSQ